MRISASLVIQHCSFLNVCCSTADTPDAPRKMAVSTQSLTSGTAGPSQGGAQPLSQRKRLLRAPTLAELDSSESDVRCLPVNPIAV